MQLSRMYPIGISIVGVWVAGVALGYVDALGLVGQAPDVVHTASGDPTAVTPPTTPDG